MMAPVREMAAQALGATVKHMTFEGTRSVFNLLRELQAQKSWEVRHGGFLVGCSSTGALIHLQSCLRPLSLIR